jgi:hypothetical protein
MSRILYRLREPPANPLVCPPQELSEFLETGADDLAKTIYGALVSGSYLVEPDVKPAAEETPSSRKRKMSVDEPEAPVKLAKATDGQAIPTFGGGVAQAQGDGTAPMQMQMQQQGHGQVQGHGFPQGQGMAGAARGGMMTRGRGRGMPGRGGMVGQGQGQRPRGKCFDYHGKSRYSHQSLERFGRAERPV